MFKDKYVNILKKMDKDGINLYKLLRIFLKIFQKHLSSIVITKFRQMLGKIFLNIIFIYK